MSPPMSGLSESGSSGLFESAIGDGRLRLTRFMECRTELLGSIRLDVGRSDHFAPLLGVVDNELAELGGRSGIGLQAQIDEPRLELRAGKRLVHQLIEDGDDP